MIQVEVPISYRANLSYFYRKDRKRWVLTYDLPSPSKRVEAVLTLPANTTERKAKQVARLKNSDLEKGLLTEKEFKRLSIASNKLTIECAIQKYLNITAIDKSSKTLENERCKAPQIFSYFRKKFSLRYIHEVTEQHILDYRSYLLEQIQVRKEFKKQAMSKLPFLDEKKKKNLVKEIKQTGMAPASAKGNFSFVKKVFNSLARNKLIPINPAIDALAIRLQGQDAARSSTVSQEQIVKLIKSDYKRDSRTDFPIKEFFLFLRETGARKGEALHLEWDDIQNGIWRIGHKPKCPTRFGLGWTPKWGKTRDIVLSPTALQILDKLPKLHSVGYISRKQKVGPREPRKPYPANFVFTVRDHNKLNQGGRRRVDNIDKVWCTFLKSAGIANFGIEKPIVHDLRRTRNVEDQHLYGLNAEARGQKLGNSAEVNKRHYQGEVDADILQIQAEINHLKAKLAASTGENLLEFLDAGEDATVIPLDLRKSGGA